MRNVPPILKPLALLTISVLIATATTVVNSKSYRQPVQPAQSNTQQVISKETIESVEQSTTESSREKASSTDEKESTHSVPVTEEVESSSSEETTTSESTTQSSSSSSSSSPSQSDQPVVNKPKNNPQTKPKNAGNNPGAVGAKTNESAGDKQ